MSKIELKNMFIVDESLSNIKDVVIHLGLNKHKVPIAKISNIPNDKTGKDCFCICIEHTNIYGKVNESFITDELLDKIYIFLSKNVDQILFYCEGDWNEEKLINNLEAVTDEDLNSNDMLFTERNEMLSVGKMTTGIEDVTFWLGTNRRYKYRIVKISNIKNDCSGKNCFIITLPELNIIGEIDKTYITNEKLKQIKEFLIKNMNVLINYDDETDDTGDFFHMLKYYDYDESIDQKMSDDELKTMDTICDLSTGIIDLILYIGTNNNYEEPIVKVSNLPNNLKGDDCFTINVKDLKITGNINKSFIHDSVLNRILKFIKKNEEVISKYSAKNSELTTDDMIDLLKK